MTKDKRTTKKEIMVRQWSFCTRCKGRGCKYCNTKGVVLGLISLNSLPSGRREYGLRTEYAKAQADFISEQVDNEV